MEFHVLFFLEGFAGKKHVHGFGLVINGPRCFVEDSMDFVGSRKIIRTIQDLPGTYHLFFKIILRLFDGNCLPLPSGCVVEAENRQKEKQQLCLSLYAPSNDVLLTHDAKKTKVNISDLLCLKENLLGGEIVSRLENVIFIVKSSKKLAVYVVGKDFPLKYLEDHPI